MCPPYGRSSSRATSPPLSRPFPESFLFGAGTSAFQIEGALAEDGRGASIWDDWTRKKRGLASDTAEIACDHYHRVAGDVALMRELGKMPMVVK